MQINIWGHWVHDFDRTVEFQESEIREAEYKSVTVLEEDGSVTELPEDWYVDLLLPVNSMDLLLRLSRERSEFHPRAHYDYLIDPERDLVSECEAFAASQKEKEDRALLEQELADCHAFLDSKDYIGTKISMGRATTEDYADVIEECGKKAIRINEIEAIL